MATLPTMKLRNKYTGAIRIVNQTTYALNLGSWGDWDVVSARSGDATDRQIEFEKSQEIIEIVRERNPNSPAFGDAKNAYEQRAVTINVNATPEPEGAKEFAGVEITPEPDQSSITERVVPVIGGKQTVKVNNKKVGRPARSSSHDEVL
jgi:hypothetical protein